MSPPTLGSDNFALNYHVSKRERGREEGREKKKGNTTRVPPLSSQRSSYMKSFSSLWEGASCILMQNAKFVASTGKLCGNLDWALLKLHPLFFSISPRWWAFPGNRRCTSDDGLAFIWRRSTPRDHIQRWAQMTIFDRMQVGFITIQAVITCVKHDGQIPSYK